jgi:hypothetical protein
LSLRKAPKSRNFHVLYAFSVCQRCAIIWFHNTIISISTISSLISQSLYYYIYMNDIKQSYLKVFDMMSGLISPKSIGLTNKEEFCKSIKELKILFSIGKWNSNKVIPLMVFLLSFVTFIINCSLLDIILFAIPRNILYTLSVHYTSSTVLWLEGTFGALGSPV